MTAESSVQHIPGPDNSSFELIVKPPVKPDGPSSASLRYQSGEIDLTRPLGEKMGIFLAMVAGGGRTVMPYYYLQGLLEMNAAAISTYTSSVNNAARTLTGTSDKKTKIIDIMDPENGAVYIKNSHPETVRREWNEFLGKVIDYAVDQKPEAVHGFSITRDTSLTLVEQPALVPWSIRDGYLRYSINREGKNNDVYIRLSHDEEIIMKHMIQSGGIVPNTDLERILFDPRQMQKIFSLNKKFTTVRGEPGHLLKEFRIGRESWEGIAGIDFNAAVERLALQIFAESMLEAQQNPEIREQIITTQTSAGIFHLFEATLRKRHKLHHPFLYLTTIHDDSVVTHAARIRESEVPFVRELLQNQFVPLFRTQALIEANIGSTEVRDLMRNLRSETGSIYQPGFVHPYMKRGYVLAGVKLDDIEKKRVDLEKEAILQSAFSNTLGSVDILYVDRLLAQRAHLESPFLRTNWSGDLTELNLTTEEAYIFENALYKKNEAKLPTQAMIKRFNAKIQSLGLNLSTEGGHLELQSLGSKWDTVEELVEFIDYQASYNSLRLPQIPTDSAALQKLFTDLAARGEAYLLTAVLKEVMDTNREIISPRQTVAVLQQAYQKVVDDNHLRKNSPVFDWVILLKQISERIV